MTQIILETRIKAPIHEVFDLSRSIDFHLITAQKTNEKVIAGRTSGFINHHETVTWKGKHFGLYLTHQSKITAFDSPHFFVDEMIKGHFKGFKHQHHFDHTGTHTIMIDILDYTVPFGTLGAIFDRLALKKHLTNFLTYRNTSIKKYAEELAVKYNTQ